MKSLIVFTQFPNSYAPQRLKEEASTLNLDVKIVPYKSVSISLKNSFEILIDGEHVVEPSMAILRSPGKEGRYSITMQAVLKWLKNRNVKILNEKIMLKGQHFDKLTQHIEYVEAKIPHIPTQIFMDLTLLADKVLEYPMILKSYGGSHGDKVRKIEKLTDIFYFSKDDAPVLLQPFLKAGRDVRVIILGGKVIGAMTRIAQQGEYLTNFSAGGEVSNFDLNLNPEVMEISENTARHFQCEYAGIDLMQDDQGVWRVLEINRFCQFEGFEKATQINMAKKIIEYLVL